MAAWRARVIGLCAGTLVAGVAFAAVASPGFGHRHHLCRHCRLPVEIDGGDQGSVADLPYGGAYHPFDGGGGSDERDIPFQWDFGRAPSFGDIPYPEGFALTVPVGPDEQLAARSGSLDRYVDVANALGRCWSSALAGGHWTDATLRVSFKRDGAVNGVPRVVHVSNAADAQTESGVRNSLLQALTHCAPLPFSPSLGKAVAGQIFAIRFVQTRNS